jgi:hypothetical protein
MENNGFEIDPRTYRTWVAFAHDFCKGCLYENGEEERQENCYNCIPTLDNYYYRERQPLIITKDKDGRNIAITITVK